MSSFAHQPPHIKKKVILLITGGIAVILVLLLVFVYTTKQVPADATTPLTFKHFYTTILDSGQSAGIEK